VANADIGLEYGN